jgi:hypothetical protein
MWPIKHAKNHIVLSYELKIKVGGGAITSR